jgi:hypothetical protein
MFALLQRIDFLVDDDVSLISMPAYLRRGRSEPG